MAASERCDLEQHRQPHDLLGEQRPGAGRMREHQRALQLGQALGADVRSREQPEAGVDAVDDAIARDHFADRRGRGVDARPGGGVEHDGTRCFPDPPQLRRKFPGLSVSGGIGSARCETIRDCAANAQPLFCRARRSSPTPFSARRIGAVSRCAAVVPCPGVLLALDAPEHGSEIEGGRLQPRRELVPGERCRHGRAGARTRE
jgi:hypothetical protein